MKTFVLGDIHGAHKALLQCLERSGFDYAEDHLICLGDVCDGFPFIKECIDELLKIKHCTFILGNHDEWCLKWVMRGETSDIWMNQGGDNTMASYGGKPMPQAHADFLLAAKLYFEHNNQLFVHGGFDPTRPVGLQGAEILVWERELLRNAVRMHNEGKTHTFGPYQDIFVGHTPTQNFGSNLPMHVCNVWAIDTGAGWAGKLTIMNVDTKEYWQSDSVAILYKGIKGRQ